VPRDVILVTQLVEVSTSEHDAGRNHGPQGAALRTRTVDRVARAVQILQSQTCHAADC